jgi:hypothetical protein
MPIAAVSCSGDISPRRSVTRTAIGVDVSADNPMNESIRSASTVKSSTQSKSETEIRKGSRARSKRNIRNSVFEGVVLKKGTLQKKSTGAFKRWQGRSVTKIPLHK